MVQNDVELMMCCLFVLTREAALLRCRVGSG